MKSIIISILIIGMQFVFTGCELFEATKPAEVVKTVPCGSPDLGKDKTEKIMVQHDLKITDFKVSIDGEIVKAGEIEIKNDCGYCTIDLNLYSCWEMKDMKVWIGKDLLDLKAIQANPELFPNYYVRPMGNNVFRVDYPYQTGWLCNDELFVTVWAQVEDGCGEYCGEGTGSAQIGTWNLIYGPKDHQVDVGGVKLEVVDGFLEVTYLLDAGWTLDEAHLELTVDLGEIPNNPAPGQFDFTQNDNDYYSNGKFRIPLNELDDYLKDNAAYNYVCGETKIYAFIHGTAHKGQQSETVWGGNKLWTNNKAMYLEFVIPCSEENNCVFDGWGEGTQAQEFPDNPLNLDKWGWFFDFTLICN